MRKLLIAILLVACAVSAEPVSQHDQLHVALLKALQLCGGQATWSMVERFRLETDVDGYVVKVNEIKISCMKATPTKLTWSAPTKREDGSPLLPSEIKGYSLFVDGVARELGAVTAYPLVPGAKCYKIRTVDIYDTTSKESNEVCL